MLTSSLTTISDDEAVRRYLAARGFVAVERRAMDYIVSMEATSSIVYNPERDQYVFRRMGAGLDQARKGLGNGYSAEYDQQNDVILVQNKEMDLGFCISRKQVEDGVDVTAVTQQTCAQALEKWHQEKAEPNGR